MRKILGTIGLAATLAGTSLLGVPAAAADVEGIGQGSNNGILNGNDVAVQVPVNVCGNSINVIALPLLGGGKATGLCEATANAQQGLIIADNDKKEDKKEDKKKGY